MSKTQVKKAQDGVILESGLSSPAIESTFYSLGATDDQLKDAVISNAREYEDEFKQFYNATIPNSQRQVVEPTFNFIMLEKIAQENNALMPCIDAMITNVDGTGFEITTVNPKETKEEDQTAIGLEGFFNEPWPNESFTSIRKKLRKDIEAVGNAYLEVLRDAKGVIQMCRWVEGKTVRLVQLDEQVFVNKTLMRSGKKITLKVGVRERAFVQKIGEKIIFFREYGSSRHINKINGEWFPLDVDKKKLPLNQRGTEIIHFIGVKDPEKPYGLPRWIPQTPSVMGSRKAEEFNNAYFNNGGIPPLMILLEGGKLSDKAMGELRKYFNSTNAKNVPAVFEVNPTGGDLNSAGKATVKVERFGNERQSDSMFEKYDERCEKRIRRSYRLPPIFVGDSSDYTFATAYTSYMVGEAQVFAPERKEFDEIINLKLMRELDPSGKYMFRSMPLSVKDVEKQLQGYDKVKDLISPEEAVNTINEIVGLDLKVDADAVAQRQLNEQSMHDAKVQSIAQPKVMPLQEKPAKMPAKKEDLSSGEAMAIDVAEMIVNGVSGSVFRKKIAEIETLPAEQNTKFKRKLVKELYGENLLDAEETGQLAEIATQLLAMNQRNTPDAI